MQQVLADTARTDRLRDSMSRFQSQERFMSAALHELQNRLEHWHREASFHQLGHTPEATPSLARCEQLETECDELAAELVHVRFAISGAGEELSQHDGRLLQQSAVRRRIGA